MINHPNRGRYTQDEIREYLADRYSADVIKTGAEASEDEAGLYFGEEDSWVVLGTMPNTNQEGWFFAGNTRDIVRNMRDERLARTEWTNEEDRWRLGNRGHIPLYIPTRIPEQEVKPPMLSRERSRR